jgi:hypothetical protein
VGGSLDTLRDGLYEREECLVALGVSCLIGGWCDPSPLNT